MLIFFNGLTVFENRPKNCVNLFIKNRPFALWKIPLKTNGNFDVTNANVANIFKLCLFLATEQIIHTKIRCSRNALFDEFQTHLFLQFFLSNALLRTCDFHFKSVARLQLVSHGVAKLFLGQ